MVRTVDGLHRLHTQCGHDADDGHLQHRNPGQCALSGVPLLQDCVCQRGSMASSSSRRLRATA